MRHAKSDWSNAKIDDHDRALTGRGEKAAKAMARYMTAQRMVPGLVLCSTAKRARLTLDAIIEELGVDVPVHYRRALYFTSPDIILDEIRDVDDSVDRLLVVGHNPDTQAIAVHLAADAHDPNVEAMARKFPTGALAIYNFDAASWRDIGWGSGKLKAFVRPKALADQS
jgi:phosphohistidine phosphatase